MDAFYKRFYFRAAEDRRDVRRDAAAPGHDRGGGCARAASSSGSSAAGPTLPRRGDRHARPARSPQRADVLGDLPAARAARPGTGRRRATRRRARRPAGRPAGLPDLRPAAPGGRSGPRRSGSASTTWATCPRWSTWPSRSRRRRRAVSSSPAGTASRSWPTQVLEHAGGAIDAVLRGEGETGAPALLAALPDRALAEVPGVVTADGAGPPAGDAAQPGRPSARPPPGRPPPQVLHRGDGPGRLDRVHPRLPLGLLVLLRLDLLRPQLPRLSPGGGGGGHGPHRRARRLHRRRRGLHQGRGGRRDRPAARAARHPQGVLPGNPLRRADPQRGGVPPLARLG